MQASVTRVHRGRLTVFVVVGVVGCLIAASAFTTDVTLMGKLLGAAFFGGTGLAAFGKAWSLVRPAPGRWAPSHFTGRFRGDSLQGVRFPVRSRRNAVMAWGTVLLGADLLVMAGFVAVTGTGVDGVAVRVVATVLAGLFGLVLFFGGLAMTLTPPAEASSVVLTPDAVHLPRPADTESVSWEQIHKAQLAARTRPGAGAGSAPGAGYLHAAQMVDLVGAEGQRLARIKVTDMPEPHRLADALHACLTDPQLRRGLSAPSTAARFSGPGRPSRSPTQAQNAP